MDGLRKSGRLQFCKRLQEGTPIAIHIIRDGAAPLSAEARDGQTLLEVLRTHGVYIAAACGGRGTCGKCAVHLRRDGVSLGARLACETPAQDGLEVTLPAARSDEVGRFKVLDAYTPQNETVPDGYLPKRLGVPESEPALGIAADIGTTTLALELLDLRTGARIGSRSAVNRQRQLGADVVTRIQLSAQGRQNELHRLILEDMRAAVARLLADTASAHGSKAASVHGGETASLHGSKAASVHVRVMAVAGNTTMLHLLANEPCASLGVFPFTPVFTGRRTYGFGELFGADAALPECPVVLLPGISAYVGADITAGMVLCGASGGKTASLHGGKTASLLIDLGTNGEMALFGGGRITVTSTAAGPAFEAGNISCGMGSVPGAVARARYDKTARAFVYETIGGNPPLGLCGTGVVDVAAELVRHGLVDETGLLADEYFDDGVPVAAAAGVVFTQKDVREIQLAKSAVRSGLEILLAESGLTYDDVGRVYLAGGFGHKINLDSAVTLGIIPEALRGKVVTVGNSALGGCARVLLNESAEREIAAIAARAGEIALSTHPRFNDLFMEHMMF